MYLLIAARAVPLPTKAPSLSIHPSPMAVKPKQAGKAKMVAKKEQATKLKQKVG